VPRRLSYWALGKDRSPLVTFLERPLLGMPPRAAAATAGPLIAMGARINGSDDAAVRDDLATLPALIDRVDALIEEGTIGGESPNAADFQIGATTRLLMNFDDIRPAIEGRPAAAQATRHFPAYAGRVPPVFPGPWLASLQRAAAS
jgi:glutathione S-transferase